MVVNLTKNQYRISCLINSVYIRGFNTKVNYAQESGIDEDVHNCDLFEIVVTEMKSFFLL